MKCQKNYAEKSKYVRKKYMDLKVISQKHKSLSNEMEFCCLTYQAFSIHQYTNALKNYITSLTIYGSVVFHNAHNDEVSLILKNQKDNRTCYIYLPQK